MSATRRPPSSVRSICWPKGPSPGQKRAADSSSTIATASAPTASPSTKGRPRTIGVRTVSKNVGPAASGMGGARCGIELRPGRLSLGKLGTASDAEVTRPSRGSQRGGVSGMALSTTQRDGPSAGTNQTLKSSRTVTVSPSPLVPRAAFGTGSRVRRDFSRQTLVFHSYPSTVAITLERPQPCITDGA